MKVSVVTVCYNAEGFIETAIQSVLNQSYQNIEYIVVDGNSTDATFEIINQYKGQITKVISESDEGIYDAMNKGIKQATGDVIGILNADDFYFDSEVIQDVVNFFDEKPTDSVYGDLVYVERNNINKVVRYWRSGEFKRAKFKYGWMLPHPAWFVKRQVYQKHGLYDLSLKTSSDYEYMLRVLYKHKISSRYLPRVMIIMRTGGTSNASLTHRIKANAEDRKAWALNGLRYGSYAAYLKPLRKILQFVRK